LACAAFLEPQVVPQQRLELRRDETHLRGELHPLLAGEHERVDRRWCRGNTIASPNIIPFFVPPNVQTSIPVSTNIERRSVPNDATALDSRAPST